MYNGGRVQWGTVAAASIDRPYSLVLPLSARLFEVFCNFSSLECMVQRYYLKLRLIKIIFTVSILQFPDYSKLQYQFSILYWACPCPPYCLISYCTHNYRSTDYRTHRTVTLPQPRKYLTPDCRTHRTVTLP